MNECVRACACVCVHIVAKAINEVYRQVNPNQVPVLVLDFHFPSGTHLNETSYSLRRSSWGVLTL